MTNWKGRLHTNKRDLTAASDASCGRLALQAWAKRWSLGLVNFVPAVAYHFFLNLPEKFSQPGVNSFGGPCKYSATAVYTLVFLICPNLTAGAWACLRRGRGLRRRTWGRCGRWSGSPSRTRSRRAAGTAAPPAASGCTRGRRAGAGWGSRRSPWADWPDSGRAKCFCYRELYL